MARMSNYVGTKTADIHIKVLFMPNIRLTDMQMVSIYKDITYHNK